MQVRRTPQRVKKISNYLAEIAPAYFANKLKNVYIIFGNNRSGKSLLARLLAVHRSIAVYPDEALELWHPQTYPWLSSRHRDYLPPFGFDPIKYSQMTLRYRSPTDATFIKAVFGAYRLLTGKTIFLNESSMITFLIPYILEHFHDVHIIHIVRDGRAVTFTSAINAYKQIENDVAVYEKLGYAVTFDELIKTLAQSWRLNIEEVEKQKQELDLEGKGVLCELRYEDLCQKPREHLGQIAAFMDVPQKVFDKIDYSHIRNKNNEYQEELNPELIREITQIMEPALNRWAYL